VFTPEVAVDADQKLFFGQHEWDTIDAATARIIPTDQDPGAREAMVVRFIDRYLSGTDYVFASPDGDGFLKMDGDILRAWTERIAEMRQLYRDGIAELDELARKRFGDAFVGLTEDQQDEVLQSVSGAPPVDPIRPGRRASASTILQALSDEGLSFFDTLVLHTRQGFYGDPVYGGNAGRVGWRVVDFPGPESLAATRDGSYSVEHLLVTDRPWEDLVPHLAQDR
jgi:gluconate 2-dehydrogenase gamma chain